MIKTYLTVKIEQCYQHHNLTRFNRTTLGATDIRLVLKGSEMNSFKKAWSLEEATRNPDAFRNKKYTIKTVIKLGRKHTALIRQAVREMSEERGREG